MPKMPPEFLPLAMYNEEVARGLVHTDEWKARMASLQQAFNAWSNKEFLRNNPVNPRPTEQ